MLGVGDNGDEWEYERIGTEREKMHVEKEIHDLRERLAQVEDWKKRREEIEQELGKVWVDAGDELEPPAYSESTEEVARTEPSESQGQETSSVVVVSEKAGSSV